MKMRSIVKRAALPALAAAMVIGAAASPAASYFTTYVTARGGYVIHLEDVRVRPHETVDANTKSIWVENTGNMPCYARVRVVSVDTAPVTYSGAGWTDGGDGYWYYGGVLQPGQSTGVLAAAIQMPTEGEGKPEIAEGTELQVVVLAESAQVLYDENGAPKPNGPGYEGWALTAKEG